MVLFRLGTNGYDNLVGDDTSENWDLLAGDDDFNGKGGDDIVFGNLGNDRILGGTGNDRLYGYRGDVPDVENNTNELIRDVIYGEEGNDVIYGQGGDDYLDGGSDIDTLYGGYGDDTVYGGLGSDLLFGGLGRDKLYGGSENDYIDGGDGDDTIEGGLGSDAVFAGSGNDIITEVGGEAVGLAFNELYGDSGNDTFNLNGGEGIAYGGDDLDSFFVSSGEWTVQGDDGDDRIEAKLAGNVEAWGGIGNDTYLVSGLATLNVNEIENEGHDTVISAQSYTLPNNVEDLFLFGGATQGTGNALDNLIIGNAGLYGYGSTTSGVTLRGGGGSDYLGGSDGGSNNLYGETGNDTAYGGRFSDTIDGGSGDDYVVGWDGNDKLIGGSNNDTLFGGAGQDRLTGGSGRDKFQYYYQGEFGDTITDFSSSDDDLNFYVGLLPGFNTPGNITSGQFYNGSRSHDADDRFIYNRGIGQLFFDADGTGSAGQTLIATFSNKPFIGSNDIVIIF